MTPEETLPPNSMSKTSIALHNLRGFVILIVIAFHSFLAYLAWQPSSPVPFDSPPYHWKAIPISDSERWFGFELSCASQYVYLMQFMFFLPVCSSGRVFGARAPVHLFTIVLCVLVCRSVRRLRADAARPLSGVPRRRVRPELVGLLDALGGIALLAHGADVVFVIPVDAKHRGFRVVLRCAPFGRTSGPALGRRSRASGPIFHRTARCLCAGLHSTVLGVQALGLGSIRTVRLSRELLTALCRVFLRWFECWGLWAGTRPGRIRRNAGAPLAPMDCCCIRGIAGLDHSHCTGHRKARWHCFEYSISSRILASFWLPCRPALLWQLYFCVLE